LRDQADSNVNRLTVKLMLEKFNKKYGSILNEEQVSIMKSYIFAPDRDTQNFLCEVKNSTLKELKKYEKVCDNKTIQEKIESVLTTINSISESSITDDNISKFLLLSSLKQEILEENHEK
jgi:cell division protein FtsX